MKIILIILLALINLPVGGSTQSEKNAYVKALPTDEAEAVTFYNPASENKEYTQPEGEEPEQFFAAVEQNLLRDIVISGDCFYLRTNNHPVYTVEQYRFDFKKTAEYSYVTDDPEANFTVGAVTGTSDGGFLFALESDPYQKSDRSWVEGSTKLVKCGKTGKAEWVYMPEGGNPVRNNWLFEKDGFFYVFGDVEASGINQPGAYRPTDVRLLLLDKNGREIAQKTYGGSDCDNLLYCDTADGGFELIVYTQSRDGDFSSARVGGGSVARALVGPDLSIGSVQTENYDYPVTIGTVGGEKVKTMKNKLTVFGLEHDYADGIPYAAIDYQDYYLILSNHTVGPVEYQLPYISSIWSYTETLYTAFDKSGKLLWKKAVDSTPKRILEYTKKEELKAAKQAGLVVFEDLRLTAGGDAWIDFIGKTEEGQTAKIRIAKYYSEGPQLYYTDLSYDGTKFKVGTAEKGNESVEEYRYLNHYVGKAREGAAFSRYDCYILTDEKDVTYEELEKSRFSSSTKDWIKHHRVYVNLIK